MTGSKRISLLLIALLLAALPAGCGRKAAEPAPEPDPIVGSVPEAAPDPTPEPAPDPTPEPSPAPERDISLAAAFRDDSLEGSRSPDRIGFYFCDGETAARIETLPREEVLAWHAAQKTLPRPRFFEDYLPESFREIYPFLDYAYMHSYSRVCIPTDSFPYSDFSAGWRYLPLTYNVNNERLSANLAAVFDLEDGRKLQYITIVINGMDRFGRGSEYQEAMAAAQALAAGVPEGSSQQETALYLYRWLTENVSFYEGDYYGGEWDLLYDALIRRQTVCAGYVEALDVLFNLAGIDCFMVGGSLYVNEYWSSHVWNAANVDGEYYLFDATLDAGVPASDYRFFGVSEDTMQAVYPRMLLGGSEKYCPPCLRDLPRPSL